MKRLNEQIPIENRGENFEPLIIINDKKTFIQHGGHEDPAKLSRKSFLTQCPLSVIDKDSLRLIQVLRLHKAIDHTGSATGSAVLLKSLIQPGTDLKQIQSKQDALREIASNDKLRLALEDLVHEFGKGESALYKFFNKGLRASFPYPDIKMAKASAVNMVKVMQAIPGAASSYLRTVMSDLYSYKGSSIDQMMNGTIYKTFRGLKSEKEVGFFTPKFKFIPRRFTEWIFAGPALAMTPYLHARSGFGPSISPLLSGMGLAWTGAYVFYGLFIKPIRDTENIIEPFRKKCIFDDAFNGAVEAIGRIDELLSCHTYAGKLQHATILPNVFDEDHHFFEATGLKSPVTAKEKSDFVPNNVHMNGVRLTFISGPNSSGKTTVCRSIVHNQLLAQMGAYVVAQKASINIADIIRYQAPKFDGLQDDEGRFGTELARTRDIFYETTPKSLVILDELAQGTTYEETLHASFEILSDFHTIGNNTVLVTHNHSLVDRFMDAQKGQCLMTGFDGEGPTYRIIPGISRVSHADKVAERINFSREDRYRHMKKNGYL